MYCYKYLPNEFTAWIQQHEDKLTDITLISDCRMFLSCNGKIIQSPFFVTKQIIDTILNKMCNGSVFACQDTLKSGYLTLYDGTRVGATGTIVSRDGKIASHIKDITSLSIRIARDINSAADKIIDCLHSGNEAYNTLIVGPPGTGKTTLLKDIARQLGSIMRVGIADERSELGNCGCTFTVKGCSKHDAILMLLRSMSPDVIVTDEIGSEEDEYALKKLINAGVKIICTAHGFDEHDLMRRRVFCSLINDGIFERIIVLSGKDSPGEVKKIITIEEGKKVA